MIRFALLTALCGLAACASTTLLDEPPSAERPADSVLDELSWITGRWVREKDGEYLEEHWSEPQGNVLLGTFRWLRGGRAWLYEFMVIEELPEGIVFHLRHFGPGSVAWEERDAPMSYPLAHLRDGEAIFENPERDDPRRFVYRRRGDELEVRVETPDDYAQSFAFRLAHPSAPPGAQSGAQSRAQIGTAR